jgi:Cdc6-like AAA superfamily ATPase
VEKIKIGQNHGVALTVSSVQEKTQETPAPRCTANPGETTIAAKSIYSRAVAHRSVEQQAILGRDQSMRDLFESLQGPMDAYSKTRLNRVIETVQPFLKSAQDLVKFGALLASVEPATSTAISIINLFTTTCVVICEASTEVFDNFKDVVSQLRWLMRCESALEQKSDVDMEEALLDVYGALLDIFFEIHSIFLKVRNSKHEAPEAHPDDQSTDIQRRKSVLVRVLLEHVKGSLAPMHKAFAEKCDNLINLVTVNTNEVSHRSHAILKNLEKNLAKAEFRPMQEFLGEVFLKQRGKQMDLANRDDSACEWILLDQNFHTWATGVDNINAGVNSKIIQKQHDDSRVKVLHLKGSVGSGKSVTTAYVADLLAKKWSGTNHANSSLILRHFCSDDNEANKEITIIKCLLSQVLALHPDLTQIILDKLDEIKSSLYSTDSKIEAWKIFSGVIGSLKDRIYIVIDGLDECDTKARDCLIKFLEHVCTSTSNIRVFLSSRNYDLNSLDLEAFVHNIQQRIDPERDERVIRFQVNTELAKVSNTLKDFAVAEILKQTKGCVVWSTLAIRYLKTKKIDTEVKMKSHLQKLPQNLRALYHRLFEAALETHGSENRMILSDSLEIMAGALRPLTPMELTWAVTLKGLDRERRRDESSEELSKVKDDFDILSLLGSFLMSSSDINSTKGVNHMQFVHQSLKEAILVCDPKKWNTKDTDNVSDFRSFDELCRNRRKALHQVLLDLCVDDIMRDDIESTPNDQEYLLNQEFRAIGGFHDEDDDAEILKDFNEKRERLGDFFSYASCHWFLHLQQATLSNRSIKKHDPRDAIEFELLLQLTEGESTRVSNWVERAAIERSSDPCGVPRDPLTIAVFYGNFIHFDRIMEVKRGVDAELDAIAACEMEIIDKEKIASKIWDRLKEVGYSSCAHIENALYEVVARAVDRLDVSTFKTLTQKGLMSTHPAVFGLLSDSWLRVKSTDREGSWVKIFLILFDVLEQQTVSFMLENKGKDPANSANQETSGKIFEIFETAAHKGCLPMVEKAVVFNKKYSPDHCTLPEHPLKSIEFRGPRNSGLLLATVEDTYEFTFGALGRAAWDDHFPVVEYLLTLDGIDHYLKNHRALGSNILHYLAARMDYIDPRITKVLIERYPEAVTELNPESPIRDLVNFATDGHKAKASLELLIRNSGPRLNGEEPNIELLFIAARLGKSETCQALLDVGGLDPWDIMRVSEERRLCLRANIPGVAGPVEPDLAGKVVQTLSQLVPTPTYTGQDMP